MRALYVKGVGFPSSQVRECEYGFDVQSIGLFVTGDGSTLSTRSWLCLEQKRNVGAGGANTNKDNNAKMGCEEEEKS